MKEKLSYGLPVPSQRFGRSYMTSAFHSDVIAQSAQQKYDLEHESGLV